MPLAYAVGFAAAFGAAVGSFLNVVIYRLPRGESIVRPGSHCPACNAAIPAWGNIPILSFVFLRGRCGRCSAAISWRYPAVEALTAALFVGILWLEPPGIRLLASWTLLGALVAVTFIDLEHHIIPNAITFPGIALGLAVSFVAPPPMWLDAALGVVIAGGIMWAISAFYEWRSGQIGLGMGDVKLVAMLGAFLGLQAAFGSMILGSLIGLVHGGLLIAVRGGGRKTRIPFGPALALAGALHVFAPGLFPSTVQLLAAKLIG